MKFLAIETSCDDTSIAVLNDSQVLSIVTHSQVETHNKFGGVIPEVASKIHVKTIHNLIEKAIAESGIKINNLEAIVVTHGPGMVNTLQIGFLVAKTLSLSLGIPYFKINHLEGHLFSPFIGKSSRLIPKESIFLIISGGHTIIGVKANQKINIYGETIDDSIGESYDKVAKILGLDYPGGPIIDKIFHDNNHKNFKLIAPVSNI